MSTRSRIAMLLDDGSYRSIYCHFDGDWVGQVLKEHFPAEQHAKALIDLGDISFITRDEAKSCKEMRGIQRTTEVAGIPERPA